MAKPAHPRPAPERGWSRTRSTPARQTTPGSPTIAWLFTRCDWGPVALRRRQKLSRPCLSPVAAFTLTELFVVIAVLAILGATQLPALNRAKVPAKFTQCMNNLRQIGQAAMLYKDNNNDAYPYGNRISGPGTGTGSVLDPTGWPMQFLRYLGGYQTNVQPVVYLCPIESNTNNYGWAFRVHYQANRQLFRDFADTDQPLRGAQVRIPARYWMFIEKGTTDLLTVRPGGLANPVLIAWNFPPGSPSYRRHNGGTCSAAADGHVEWLRLPPYRPNAPPPSNFLELGDCSNGVNPGSTWVDTPNRVKLYSRETTQGFGGGGSAF